VRPLIRAPVTVHGFVSVDWRVPHRGPALGGDEERPPNASSPITTFGEPVRPWHESPGSRFADVERGQHDDFDAGRCRRDRVVPLDNPQPVVTTRARYVASPPLRGRDVTACGSRHMSHIAGPVLPNRTSSVTRKPLRSYRGTFLSFELSR